MKSEKISAFLQERIDAKDFPAAVYLAAEKGEIVFSDALGFAVKTLKEIPAKLDTIYDLASLTKPLVTGLLCAKLLEKSEIDLQDKIAKFFTEFEREDKREITIENLLTHASGFPAWKSFYLFNHLRLAAGLPADILDWQASPPLNVPKTFCFKLLPNLSKQNQAKKFVTAILIFCCSDFCSKKFTEKIWTRLPCKKFSRL